MADGTRFVEVAPGEWYASLGHLQTAQSDWADDVDRSPLGPFASFEEALIEVETRYGKLAWFEKEPWRDPDVENLLCLVGLDLDD